MATLDIAEANNGRIRVYAEYNPKTLEIIGVYSECADKQAGRIIIQTSGKQRLYEEIATTKGYDFSGQFMLIDEEDKGLKLPFEVGVDAEVKDGNRR